MTPEIQESCFAFAKNPVVNNTLWEDITTYSYTDKVRIPTIFKTKIADCTISIVMGHIYYPDTWIMNCYELNLKDKPLKDTITAADAATKALAICKNKISLLYNEFNKY